MDTFDKENLPSVEEMHDAVTEYAGAVLFHYAGKLRTFSEKLTPGELVIILGYLIGQIAAQDSSGNYASAISIWASKFALAARGQWAEISPGKPFPDVVRGDSFVLMLPEVEEENTNAPRPDPRFYFNRTTDTIQ